MSRTIDERVVEMRFNNKDFEKNAQTSISTLDKLKRSLHLEGASKGLDEINNAAKTVTSSGISGVSTAVENLRYKFSALQVMGVTALANITNSAVNAGKRIVKALTIDPIKTGFQEYETQINAVQTILANTESKGSTLTDVNKALDELNTYADKTIYNFTEMTRNIGTFTAAGVDLDTSVAAIKGIANLAAISGSNSQQASTAMYQLSQALASGTVKLMDWNSVVNAGMGGQVFQDALKETARAHGIAIDDMIKKEGSFRETLQNGWLSSEILTETLSKFTGDLSKEQLKSMGYTDEQIKKIMKMGQTANDAATKVKTFTQLFDTLKEAAQSGWTQTWEILIGDFEEAKALLTSISDTISNVLNKSAEARNNLLQGWKDLGGRTQLIEGIKNIFLSIVETIKPISQAFKEIFPATTSKQLYDLTIKFKEFTEKLLIGSETADKIKRTFKGVFSIFSMLKKVLMAVGKVIAGLFSGGGVTGLLDLVLTITAAIGDFFTSLNSGFSLKGFSNALSNITSGISKFVKSVTGGFEGLGDGLSKVGQGVLNIIKSIWKGFESVLSWITDHVSVGDIFAGLAGGGIFLAAKKLTGFLDNLKESILGVFKGGDAKGLKESFTDVLGSVHDSLQAFTSGIKAGTLLTIAGAIGILSASLKTIAGLDAIDISKSMLAIGIMFGMLNISFKSFSKTLSSFQSKGLIRAGISIMMLAKSIKILADAMVKLSGLSLKSIAKGLIGVSGGMVILTSGMRALNGVKIKLSTTVGMLALAKSCSMIGDALSKFKGMKWGEIARGLTGMGGALGELMIVMTAMNKVSGFKSLAGSISLTIAVKSLDEIAENLKKIGDLSWKQIRKGLVGMGGALVEIGAISGTLGKLTGFSGLLGSISINTVSKSLIDISEAFKNFAGMSWKEIKMGLVGMGGALTEVSAIAGTIGKLSGFSGLLGAATISVAVGALVDLGDAFKKFAGMTWNDIIKGLSGMGGALTEVSVIAGTLGKLTGLSGILGSATINVVVESLGDLAASLQKFAGMTWDEIKRGLAGMGGALAEVSLMSGALGKLAGFSGLLGGGAILLAVKELGNLANAFKTFGGMTWDEIKRGLVGMGGALTEVGIIAGALGKLGGLASLIGSGSIYIAVKGLGDLANAFKKFGDMSWDEVKAGLAAMGGALGELALGSLANTLSIIGGLSISVVADDLGILADSIKKWKDVSVPENLGTQLEALGEGVRKFTFSGFGASAMSLAATGIGTLADSVKKWAGVSIPSGLAERLKSLAGGVKAFSTIGNISSSAESVSKISSAVYKLSGVNFGSISSGMNSFGKALVNLGSASSSISGLGNKIVTNILNPIKSSSSKFSSAGSSMVNSFLKGIKSKSGASKSAMRTVVNGALSSAKSRNSSFMAAGTKISNMFATGITKGASKAKSSASKTCKSVIDAIRRYYNSFYNAGKYLVDGFAEGITANTWKAEAKAEAMANAAKEAAKKALKEHSPSKEGYWIGDYFGIGFVNGIGNNIRKAFSVSDKMAGSAKSGLENAVDRIQDYVAFGIDTNPTITPIIDLSDVDSKAKSISSILSMSPSMSLLANARDIGSMVNGRIQNGQNSDLINAINRLRSDLGNIGGDTYTINGVTYDDGSNITDAVKTLVRAAKVERRV